MAKTVTKQPAKKPQWRRTFIREWRQAKPMTLAELADKMGMNEGYLSEIENGQRRYNQDILERAATALGVPAGYLLSRKPPPGERKLDYSDPYLAANVLEKLKDDDRQHIAALIESYHKKH